MAFCIHNIQLQNQLMETLVSLGVGSMLLTNTIPAKQKSHWGRMWRISSDWKALRDGALGNHRDIEVSEDYLPSQGTENPSDMKQFSATH
jgi:hypothetical protein